MAQNPYGYNFSLFDPDYDGSSAPQLEPDYGNEVVPFRSPSQPKKKKQKSAGVSALERRAVYASIKAGLKVIAALIFVFSLTAAAMYLNARLDETANSIRRIESEIKIADSENVRLNANLKSLVSIDKVDQFAVSKLGMVKLENYKITYLPQDENSQIVISGGKSYEDNDAGSKLSKLKEYLFD